MVFGDRFEIRMSRFNIICNIIGYNELNRMDIYKMIHHLLCFSLLLPLVYTQSIDGSFSGNPGTGSGRIQEGTSVGFTCDVTQPVQLLQIYLKISQEKMVIAEVQNDSSVEVSFNINRTMHGARFSCKAFWANGSEAYKSGEKWYNVLFSVTEITLTTSVSSTDHVFEEDQTVVLTCECNEGEPTPTIVWSRDGGSLDSQYEEVVDDVREGGSGYERVSSTLTINTRPFMNRAQYVCEVQGKADFRQTYSMDVLFPPKWTSIEASPTESIVEGKWLSLTCTVGPSHPGASILWYLDDTLVTDFTPNTELTTALAFGELYHAKGSERSLRVKAIEGRHWSMMECRVIYIDRELPTLAKSHRIEIKAETDMYIYVGAAAGGTVTFVLLITVIIIVCQKRRKSKSQGSPTRTPEESYDYILETQSQYAPVSEKPSAQSHESQLVQARGNDYTQPNDRQQPHDNWQLGSLDQLSLPTLVKEGAYSIVRAGTAKQGSGLATDHYVAAKVLKGSCKTYFEEMFKSQLQAMRTIGNHDNVLQLLAFVDNKKQHAIVTKYFQSGNLQHFLRSHETGAGVTSNDLIGMALDVAHAMRFLSTQQPPFLHHQLSGDHVLVGPRMQCKVTGFTSGAAVLQREAIEAKYNLTVDIRWKAPELLGKTSPHTVQSDVWAFGVLLYEITTFGSVPYPGLSPADVKRYVLQHEYMARPGFISANMYEVMRSCWSWQQYDRPSFVHLVCQLEKLQGDAYQHIDVQQAFRPGVSEHLRGGR